MEQVARHKMGLEELPRVQAIWEHPVFQHEYRRLERLERDRVFCRHGMRHLLDTARIMWARNLELGCGVDREVIYAAALLHDVGKAGQYEGGEPHEVGGARIAARVLDSLPDDLAFAPADREAILAAIRGHRRLREGAGMLERLLFQADKASRACFACPAVVRDACSWPDEKKNLDIRV